MRVWVWLRLMSVSVMTLLVGCQSSYSSVLGNEGLDNNRSLAGQVQQTREVLQQNELAFKNAKKPMKALAGYDEGDDLTALIAQGRLTADACNSASDALSARLTETTQQAETLFTDWQASIDQLSDKEQKIDSSDTLWQAKQKFHHYLQLLRTADNKAGDMAADISSNVVTLELQPEPQVLSDQEEIWEAMLERMPILRETLDRALSQSDSLLRGLEKSRDKEMELMEEMEQAAEDSAEKAAEAQAE